MCGATNKGYATPLPDSPSSPVLCPSCTKPGVKPSTVLYGRSLPRAFHESCATDLPRCDLLLVAGTSLTVSPANYVPSQVPPACLRVLVNNERVGYDVGLWRARTPADIFLPGSCDDVIASLLVELGWQEDVGRYAPHMCDRSRAATAALLGA